MTKLNTAPPKALVIHCSSPRFQNAFHDFIRDNLKLADGDYIPIIVPGSVSALGADIASLLPKNHKTMFEQVKLMLSQNEGRPIRLILINHEDCKGYAEIVGKFRKFFPQFSDTQKKQIGDLGVAAKLIQAAAIRFGINVHPELYMARIGQANEVIFDQFAFETKAA